MNNTARFTAKIQDSKKIRVRNTEIIARDVENLSNVNSVNRTDGSVLVYNSEEDRWDATERFEIDGGTY